MKLYKILFLVALFIPFLTFFVFAQAPDTLWTRIYGGTANDIGYSVQQASDGGYIITGFTESFGAGDYDVYLIKTDENGYLLWSKTYGGPLSDQCYSVQQTLDGGYVMVGLTSSFGGDDNDVYLIKTDSLGDTLWTRIYGGTSHDWGRSVFQTTDGGYIIVGSTSSYGAGGDDIYLIKTDSLGDSVWTKTYGDTARERGRAVQQTNDGGYIIVGFTESYGAGEEDVYLIKTDPLGDTLWTNIFGGNSPDYGHSVQQTNDGGYIVAGHTKSYGSGEGDIYIIKTDLFGDTLWTKKIGGTELDVALSIQQTLDKGYIATGFTGATEEDIYIIKTDSLGDSLWTKTFGGQNRDRSFCIELTTDNGYILTGWTNSFGSGEGDVWLIKLNSDIEDTIPPLIDSTTVWTDTTYAGPFPVYTKVTDNTEVETVLLYFKRTEDPSWFSIEMLVGGLDWYYGEIPQAFLYNDTIKYYIYASDIAQPANEATDPPGAPANYYSFIANMVGIEEYQIAKHNSNLENIKIYPNPFINVLRIDGCSEVKVYDISGRFVVDVKEEWDGRNAKGKEVKAGFYFLKSEGLHIEKVIKLR